MSCQVHLSQLVADQTTLWFRAQAAHWNVVGDDFTQMHDFFGDLADDVLDSIDPTAENIRKLGFLSPSSIDGVTSWRSVPKTSQEPSTDPKVLLKDLRVINNALINKLYEAFKGADGENLQGIANFLADRIDAHEKWRWQIDAHLGLGDKEVVRSEKREAPKPAPKKAKASPVPKKVAPMIVRPPQVDR